MSEHELLVVGDRATLAAEAAERVLARAAEAIEERGAFHVALAGGSTPRDLYRKLVGRESDYACWHVWFGDERFVPAGDEASNLRMARETLLARVPIPPAQVHAIATELPDAESAARAYAEELRQAPAEAGTPRLDLVLLGMGADGHTASLFPGDAACEESARWAVAARPAGVEPERISLTLPVLNAARAVLFLVAGAEKAAALSRVLTDGAEPPLPAARVRPRAGDLTWIVDRAAAAALV